MDDLATVSPSNGIDRQISTNPPQNGHLSNEHFSFEAKNEESTKILIKYHQNSEVSLHILTTSEEILQENGTIEPVEEMDISEKKDLQVLEIQNNPLNGRKTSIPIITINSEVNVEQFDEEFEDSVELVANGTVLENLETPIMVSSMEEQGSENLESKEDLQIEVEANSTARDSMMASEIQDLAPSNVSEEAIVSQDGVEVDSMAHDSTMVSESEKLATSDQKVDSDAESALAIEQTPSARDIDDPNPSDPVIVAGNLTVSEEISQNLLSTPIDSKEKAVDDDKDEADESDVVSDKLTGAEVRNGELREANDEKHHQISQQSHPIVPLIVIENPIQRDEQPFGQKVDEMPDMDKTPLRRNLRSAVSLKEEGSPTPPPRRFSLSRTQTAVDTSGKNSPDRRSLVSLPRGRLYFPSNGLPTTPGWLERVGKRGKRGKRSSFSK